MQPFELGGSFESFNDPSGSPLIKLNRNGSIYCQSLDVVNPAGAPLQQLIRTVRSI